jgi:transcriptional regulator of acetoin/glycerol metabolism
MKVAVSVIAVIALPASAAAEISTRYHDRVMVTGLQKAGDEDVRELKQAIDVAAVLADGPVRTIDLPETLAPPASQKLDEDDTALRADLVRRLAETDRNVSQIARDMGKARQQIQRWIKRFGI